MKREAAKYVLLWVVIVIVATLAARIVTDNVSVGYLMGTKSFPILGGGAITVPLNTAIPLGHVWYYLILAIAGSITLAKILSVVARSAIARNWKRAGIWLGGTLAVAFATCFVSLLAYRGGPWQMAAAWIFFATRGPFWPTLLFTALILVAKLLSDGAQTPIGKTRLFLALSTTSIGGVLVAFAAFPMSASESCGTRVLIVLITACLLELAFGVLVIIAAIKLVAGVVLRRRERTSASVTPAAALGG